MPTPVYRGVDLKGDHWSFGCEHELADWDTALGYHPGCYRTPDVTVVNSNGVAAQPSADVYRFGGELNTPPTPDPAGQAAVLACSLGRYAAGGPPARVNHRSNLHVHVRVPGLKDSLPLLKRVQKYVHQPALWELLDQLIEPIPPGVTPAERKRARRRRVSHRTFLTPARLDHQLKATTVTEFFEREVPRSRAGAVMWHAQPRCCVNLRQLLQTDTVEFRHFPGTLDPAAVTTCVEWCREFLLAALAGEPLADAWGRFFPRVAYLGKSRSGGLAPFPKFPAFDEEREVRFRATEPGKVPPDCIRANIRLILEGRFNAATCPAEYAAARAAAGCSD